MFCHKCGAEILEGGAFCPKCGEKLPAASQYKHEQENKTYVTASSNAQNGNFFKDCWNGQKPLAFTFWVGFFVNAALNLIVGIAWLLALPATVYMVFWWVSTWRSAGNYKGSNIWKYLARIAIVLSVLCFAYYFLEGFTNRVLLSQMYRYRY